MGIMGCRVPPNIFWVKSDEMSCAPGMRACGECNTYLCCWDEHWVKRRKAARSQWFHVLEYPPSPLAKSSIKSCDQMNLWFYPLWESYSPWVAFPLCRPWILGIKQIITTTTTSRQRRHLNMATTTTGFQIQVSNGRKIVQFITQKIKTPKNEYALLYFLHLVLWFGAFKLLY